MTVIPAIISVILGTGAGFYFSRRLDRRVRRLRELSELLMSLETMIRWSNASVIEMLVQLSGSSPFAVEIIGKAGGNGSFSEAWQLAAEGCSELTNEDRALIIAVGNELGKTDAKGQTAMLSMNAELLRRQLDEAAAERVKKGKMYRTTGVCAGVAIAVILV